MSEHDEVWLPLVDEPIGSIVAQIQADDGIEVAYRPDHDVTLGLARRALTVERGLISRLAPALYALRDRDRPMVARLIERAPL